MHPALIPFGGWKLLADRKRRDSESDPTAKTCEAGANPTDEALGFAGTSEHSSILKARCFLRYKR